MRSMIHIVPLAPHSNIGSAQFKSLRCVSADVSSQESVVLLLLPRPVRPPCSVLLTLWPASSAMASWQQAQPHSPSGRS